MSDDDYRFFPVVVDRRIAADLEAKLTPDQLRVREAFRRINACAKLPVVTSIYSCASLRVSGTSADPLGPIHRAFFAPKAKP